MVVSKQLSLQTTAPVIFDIVTRVWERIGAEVKMALAGGALATLLLLIPSQTILRLCYRFPTANGKYLPMIPGANLLGGNMNIFDNTPEDFVKLLDKTSGPSGRVSVVWACKMMPPFLFVSSAEDIKEVLGAKATMASDRALDPLSGPIFGKALFAVGCSQGDWKRQHRVCTRGFGTTRKMEEYAQFVDRRVEEMVNTVDALFGDARNPKAVTWNFASINAACIGSDAPALSMGKLFTKLSVNVVADLTVHGCATPEELELYLDNVQTWLLFFSEMFSDPWVIFSALMNIPLPSVRKYNNAVRGMQQLIADIIDRCKAQGLQGTSLIEELLRAGDDDGALSAEEVNHNVFGFIIAGSLTTGDLLTTTVFMLAQHPEIQRKLLEEVDCVKGKLVDAKTPFLDAVLNETLRLYPPTGFTGDRTFNKPCVVDNMRVPAPTAILVNNLSAHRRAEWGADAWEWRPSRWLDGTVSDFTIATLFNPFGNGVRHCIGKHLSLIESRSAICALYRKFTFSECEPEKFKMQIIPSVTPLPHLRITAHRR